MEFEGLLSSTQSVHIMFLSIQSQAVGLAVYMGQTGFGVSLQEHDLVRWSAHIYQVL